MANSGSNWGEPAPRGRGRPRGGSAGTQKRKDDLLAAVEKGMTVEAACKAVGVTEASWKYYKRTDENFSAAVELMQFRRQRNGAVPDMISFEEFSRKFLKSELFNHQLQWIDCIEGRTPRNLHPNQTYHPGDPDYMVINTPPSHAKSTTITMNYVTYKIVTNPEFRVVIISKTEKMAKKFLVGIKRRLTNRAFSDLQAAYAPPEGYERSAEMWSASMIYFGHGDSDQKDPNVEVLGIGGQIYGSRADLIILDDVADLDNASQYEAQMDYIMQDVMSRDASILVVGTRVAPVDIYSELLNPEHYDGEESSWTYLSQPAVFEYGETPKDWVTLWPYTDRPHARHPGSQREDGMWPKWDGERLAKLRRGIKPATWALVYMQQYVSEDALFTIEMINGVQTNRHRGYKIKNLDHSYTVAGLDPATQSGYTACAVLQIDKYTSKRYLIDMFNKQLRPAELRRLIEDFTEKYNINEWRIEQNAFQSFLTQDREINQFLAARGVRLKAHSTLATGHARNGGMAKYDPEWGVASLDALFKGWEVGEAIFEVPGMSQNEAYKAWKEQMVTWYPGHPKNQKTDTVMALWFAELAARDATRDSGIREQGHVMNKFASPNQMAARVVINIDDYLRDQRATM